MTKKIVFLIVFTILVIVLVLYFVKIHPTPKKLIPVSISPALIKLENYLELSSETGGLYQEKIPSKLIIRGSAKKHSLIGFDLNLNFDNRFINIININNRLENKIDLYINKKSNMIIITGIKKVGYNENLQIDNTALVEISFLPMKPGTTTIAFDFSKNSNRDSNLIAQGQGDVLDGVTNLKVRIGRLYSFKKNGIINFDSGLKLQLLDFQPLKENCFDCLSFAYFTASKNKVKKDIKFEIGGFGGLMINRLSFNNVIFVIDKINDNGVDLIIYEK